jgi:hypothetical protein
MDFPVYPLQELSSTMKSFSKDDLLTALALSILLYSAMITWTIISWIILVAIILVALAWYFRKQ